MPSDFDPVRPATAAALAKIGPADDLQNCYFALRHAESLANQQGIIVSDPQVGCHEFGLAEAGKIALARDAERYRRELAEPHIYSSDFLRTRETAEILAAALGRQVHCTPRLRERSFGDFDGTSNLNYEKVWAVDRTDPHHTAWNVESVWAVARRTWELVVELERGYAEATFVLVSHGDPIQILECAFRGKPLGQHRDLDRIQPGELRRLHPIKM